MENSPEIPNKPIGKPNELSPVQKPVIQKEQQDGISKLQKKLLVIG